MLPGSTGEQLWEYGLVSRLLADGSLGAKAAGLLALIETPEAMEAYLLRAQGQDDASTPRPARRGGHTTHSAAVGNAEVAQSIYWCALW